MSVTDGIAVNQISAELEHLAAVCRCAGSDAPTPADREKSLNAVAFMLDTLAERASEIGARLEAG